MSFLSSESEKLYENLPLELKREISLMRLEMDIALAMAEIAKIKHRANINIICKQIREMFELIPNLKCLGCLKKINIKNITEMVVFTHFPSCCFCHENHIEWWVKEFTYGETQEEEEEYNDYLADEIMYAVKLHPKFTLIRNNN